MPNLTDISIKAATSGTLWDDSLKGFGVRIGKTSKTFIVLVASGRRQSIGRYPLMSLAEARKEAKRILAEKMLGKVRPKHLAFDDAKKEYLEECAKKNRPSTLSDYTKILRRHYPFGRKAVGAITPHHILKELQKLNDKPTRKHYAFAVGRAFFKWCVRQHIIDRSPMEDLEPPKITAPRERVLDENELQKLTAALRMHETPFKRICLLLLLTGQRRGEISHLQWDWIEGDTITLPGTLTKNKRTHTFPIGEKALAVLDTIPREKDCPYLFPASRKMSDKTTVFNGWGKPKASLDRECGITGWTLHDLRRTVSSGMAALGIQQIIVEKLLNHVSGGTQSPISLVYNRHSYIDEMREAILQWEAYLDTLNTPEG
ncbi:MAG: tyrosine-type recombinase/integrase [Candidatus Thiodiazotropha endolucinida]